MEVVDLSASRKAWKKRVDLAPRGVLAVESMEGAIEQLRQRSGFLHEMSEEPLDWHDMTDNLRSLYVTKMPPTLTNQEWRVIENRVISLTEVFESHVARWLPLLPNELQYIAARLLESCALCRAAVGKSASFWEAVFCAFSSGGIPVG